MNFLPLDYLAWARAHQGNYPYDLSVSGMSVPPPEVFTPDASCISLQAMSADLRLQVKRAIAQTYAVDASQVLLASGTSEANFLVYGALLSPGDALLVETPTYQPMSHLASVFGARALSFARDAERDFAFDLQALRRPWTPEVKLVALTSPHNPSGFSLSEENLRELGAWLESVDAYAVVDEVYRDFNPQAGPVAQAVHPRLITTASLTKVYGLGSLRAGWALLPPELVARAEQLYLYMAAAPATTVLRMQLQGLAVAPQLRARNIARAAENRALLDAWLKTSQCFSASLPPHGIVAVMQWRAGGDDQALTRYLAERSGVLLAPGSFFGLPGKLRIAYGMESAGLSRALDLLETTALSYRQ